MSLRLALGPAHQQRTAAARRLGVVPRLRLLLPALLLALLLALLRRATVEAEDFLLAVVESPLGGGLLEPESFEISPLRSDDLVSPQTIQALQEIAEPIVGVRL